MESKPTPKTRNRGTLGEWVKLVRGTTYKGNLVGEPGPVLLGLSSISPNGGFRRTNFDTYGGDCAENIVLKSGDIYVSLKDVTQSADLLGAVARLPKDISSGRLTQDTVRLIATRKDTPWGYIYWLLRTPQYRNFCWRYATGTTTLGLGREDFLGYPVPDFTAERRSIVQALEAIERRHEELSFQSETLEALPRAIFKSWFVDFHPVRAKAEGRDPEGMDADTAALFPSGLQDSPLGKIPSGWEAAPLYGIAEFSNGAAYKDIHYSSNNEGLPVIKIAELKAGVTESTRFTTTYLAERFRIEQEEILFSRSGNPDTSIDTFIWDGGPAWLNQHIFRVRENGYVPRSWIYIQLKTLRPVFAEIARDKQTTGLGHVTVADMKRLLVCKPTDEIVLRFDEIAKPILARIAANQ